jgi:hypothetical protein
MSAIRSLSLDLSHAVARSCGGSCFSHLIRICLDLDLNAFKWTYLVQYRMSIVSSSPAILPASSLMICFRSDSFLVVDSTFNPLIGLVSPRTSILSEKCFSLRLYAVVSWEMWRSSIINLRLKLATFIQSCFSQVVVVVFIVNMGLII